MSEFRMPFPRASSALSRFTVLDLTRVRSGPTCVRQLADWGANVVKIDALMEDAAGEQPGGPRQGSDFQNLHRNKRAMTLNLKDKKGLEVFRRLVEKADVVVENFRPDVKARLGIDYESLRAINPRIVYGSISGFGQDGPYHKRPGFDQIAQGMGGLMSITGAPGDGPMRVGIPVADLTAGLFCAIGILTALLERDVSGEGQWVQTSLLQAQNLHAGFPGRALADGKGRRQTGRQQPSDRHSDRRVQDLGRLHQYRHHRRADLETLRAGDRRARTRDRSGIRDRPGALEEPRRAQRCDQQVHREEIHRHLGQGAQRRWRALRPDLFDRSDVRGRPGQASRHRSGGAECGEPSHPSGWPAGHAVAHPKQNGSAATGVRRADRRGAGRIRLQRTGDRGTETGQGGVRELKKPRKSGAFFDNRFARSQYFATTGPG